MSDCDSDEYCSSDDEDYVPSGGECSEDDVNELEKEDDDNDGQEDGEEKSKSKTKKTNKKSITARKRKKAVLVLNSEEGTENNEDKAQNSEEDNDFNMDEEKKKKLEEVKKKRADDLWSSFLTDVGQKTKAPPPAQSKKDNQVEPEKPKASNTPPQQSTEAKEDSKKVTITKVFDFAGEEVRVTKEVDSSSKEAKEFIKQQGKEQTEKSPVAARPDVAAGSGVKRPVGMSSILGKLGSKKMKMSTLEKSKLDWDTFKEQEGISDELAIHNRGKDGYIDRKAFLERVDYRQFEREREIRLKNMKPS
ncbi:PREDICTED: craniofacial development protein 1 [Nanorana parkeri]|uniref:craniofacial development protein 1 n=1 Tax=Nanorana parkeri TaxID=125878 RepID=UPI0008547DB0|nr:PREDICTED: craniofacial development protein 1 [Nanorana parkeri]